MHAARHADPSADAPRPVAAPSTPPPPPRLAPARAPRSLYNNIKAPSQLQPSATYYLFKDSIAPKWEDPKNANGGCWTATLPRTPNPGQMLDAWWLHVVRGAARRARTLPAVAACSACPLRGGGRLRRVRRRRMAVAPRHPPPPAPARRAPTRSPPPHGARAAQVLACIGEQFEESDEVCGVTVNIRNGKNRIEMWTKTAANEALQARAGAAAAGCSQRGARLRGCERGRRRRSPSAPPPP